MCVEEIICEFPAGKRIPEFLRVVITRSKFADNFVRLIRDLRLFKFHQPARSLKHREVGFLSRFFTAAAIEGDLRLK